MSGGVTIDIGTERLIRRLEACELEGGELRHADHVRAAWGMLRLGGLEATLERYPKAIRHFAASLGAASKFHATITWAFLFLIHQRMAELGDAHEWSEFERAGPELFADHRALLLRLYTAERLDSELARRSFLLPDRVASAHGREARG